MIYERVDPSMAIRQGDIFQNVPRVDISLENMAVFVRSENAPEACEMDWHEAIETPEVVEIPSDTEGPSFVRAMLPLAAVHAIVISQDCDAARDEELSFCEIGTLPSLWKQFATAKPKKHVDMLTRQDSDQIKFFYLPPDPKLVGFTERMAADFSSILRLPRTELEALKYLRLGRLNSEAYQHFREKLAQYFRRYPVDPWYPLTKEEFEEYTKNRAGVEPRPWQC